MALDGFDDLSNPPGAFGTDFGLPDGARDKRGADGFLQIIQIEGPSADRIEVVLSGRSMPYRQVDFGVEQRRKLTTYTGNPVATQQVLGPAELPTTIKGTFKDRFIQNTIAVNGDPQAIDTAEKAVQLFDNMARAGKRVRVQWLSSVRFGLIAEFVPTWLRATDCEWRIEFEWAGRDDEVTTRVVAEKPPASDILNRMNELEDLFTAFPEAAARLEAQLVTAIHSIRDRVSKVFGVLRAYETIVNLPSTLLGALRSDVDALRDELLEFDRRLSPRSSAFDAETSSRVMFGTVDQALVQRSGVGSGVHSPTTPSGFTTQTSANATGSAVVATLKFEIWRRGTLRAASRLLFAAQQQLTAINARLQPQATARHQVKEGETLYSIAADFYGSPDNANYLAQANRLTSAIVPPGTVLRIPPRPFGPVPELTTGQLQPCGGR